MKLTQLSLLLLSTALIFGCAHGKMGNVQQGLQAGAFDKSTMIYVEPIDASRTSFSGDKSADQKTTDNARSKIQSEFNRKIVEELTKKGYSAKMGNPPQGKGLVLTGNVTKIENGSAAARYFVGMGAGSANMFTDFKLEDMAKAQTLAKFEVIGTSGGSSGVGSFLDNHIKDSAKKTADYIDNSLYPKAK